MKKKILLIDDDPSILHAVQLLLEMEGYTVIAQSDADHIFSTIYSNKPDLIILDLFLPGIHGDKICNQLRDNPQTKNLPIILFSANNSLAKVMKECRANAFIAKPFDMEYMLKTVSQLL